MTKKIKTISEYAIRKWLESNNFDMDWFVLLMHGNSVVLEDRIGNKISLEYDPQLKEVNIS